MNGARDIDVRSLPTLELGPRAPIYLGQLLMMVIEGTIVALLIGGYLYTRASFLNWPPPNEEKPHWVLPTVGLILLLLSVPPIWWSGKGIEERNRRKAMIGLLLNLVLAAAFLITRWAELVRLDFKWTTDVYGSYVWTLLGLHTIHAIADTCESAVFLVILLARRVGEKQMQGFKVDAVYWYFVVLINIPIWFVVYMYPLIAKWT